MKREAAHIIADLHLSPGRPELSRHFHAYLDGPARQAEQLFILGDLFEVWAGDTVSIPLYRREIDALKALSDTGVGVFFICGNRDFLCGSTFAAAAGLTLLNEPHRLFLDPHADAAPASPGQSNHVLLMHGDSLCTDDNAYQRFRRIVRNPMIQSLYGLLPDAAKRRLVSRIRQNTQTATRQKPMQIMDVNTDAVEQVMQQHADCKLLIHGHTHRPADHALNDGRMRLVLSDWHDTHGEYLALHRQGDWSRHRVEAEARSTKVCE